MKRTRSIYELPASVGIDASCKRIRARASSVRIQATARGYLARLPRMRTRTVLTRERDPLQDALADSTKDSELLLDCYKHVAEELLASHWPAERRRTRAAPMGMHHLSLTGDPVRIPFCRRTGLPYPGFMTRLHRIRNRNVDAIVALTANSMVVAPV